MIVALFAVVIIATAFGQTTTVPSVGISASISTAGKVVETAVETTNIITRAVRLNSPSSSLAAVSIKVVPILAPPQGTPSSGSVLEWLIRDWVTGDLVSDHGYQLCRGKISTENVNARSGMVVQQLVEVKSLSGLDEVSLSEILVKSASTPTALNRTYEVGENGYGLLAVGYKANGTVVTDGSPTQKVARVIFITQMAIFNDAQEKIDSWVQSWSDFTIDYEVRHGSSAYVGRGTVSLNGYDNIRPSIVMTAGGGFTVSGGDQNRPYVVQSSPEVEGPYIDIGFPVYSGDVWWLPGPNQMGPQEFFRLRDAGW